MITGKYMEWFEDFEEGLRNFRMTPGAIRCQDVFSISFMAGSFAFLKQFRL